MKTIQDINNFISPELQQQYNLSGDNLAMFLAQCDHESQGFTQLVENFNYTSAERLTAVFPKYFNTHNVNDYVGKPEAIANRVYANKMGNSHEDSGEGFMYRGSGYLMLTGAGNYYDFYLSLHTDYLFKHFNADFIANNKILCLQSALWIWKNLKLADCDIVTCTKKLNGGLNGLDARSRLFDYYKGIVKYI